MMTSMEEFDDLFFKDSCRTTTTTTTTSTTIAAATTAATTSTTGIGTTMTQGDGSASNIRSSSSSSEKQGNDDDNDDSNSYCSSGLSVSSSSSSNDDDDSSSSSDNDSIETETTFDNDDSFFAFHDTTTTKQQQLWDGNEFDDDGKENRMPTTTTTTAPSSSATASSLTSTKTTTTTAIADNSASSYSQHNNITNNNNNNIIHSKHEYEDDDLVDIFSRSSSSPPPPPPPPPPSSSSSTTSSTSAVNEHGRKAVLSQRSSLSSSSSSLPSHLSILHPEDDAASASSSSHPYHHHPYRQEDSLDTLDTDALAELDENDSVHGEDDDNVKVVTAAREGYGSSRMDATTDAIGVVVDSISTNDRNAAETTTSPSSSIIESINNCNSNHFTITYNCEKRECAMMEEELLDFSDDDDDEENEYKTIAVRQQKARSSTDDNDNHNVGDDSHQKQQHQHQDKISNDNSIVVENLGELDTMMIASVDKSRRSGSGKGSRNSPASTSLSSSTSSLDTPREMESSSPSSSSTPPPPPSVPPRRPMTTTMKTFNLQNNATSHHHPTNLRAQTKPRMNPYQTKKKQPSRQQEEAKLAELDENDSVHGDDDDNIKVVVTAAREGYGSSSRMDSTTDAIGIGVVNSTSTNDRNAAETTTSPSSSIIESINYCNSNHFTITYNCEKRECAMMEEELLDFSDDYDEENEYKTIIAVRREKVRSSTDDNDNHNVGDDSHQQQQHQHRDNRIVVVENLGELDTMRIASVDKSRRSGSGKGSRNSPASTSSSSSSTSSLDTPREMESSSPSSSSTPPPPPSVPPRRPMTTTMKTFNLQNNATSHHPTNLHAQTKPRMNSYQTKKKQPSRQQEEAKTTSSHSPLKPSMELIDLSEERSLESTRASIPPRPSNINRSTDFDSNTTPKDATTMASTTAIPTTTSTSRVVTLPDIGLSPDVHLSELQRFGINHTHMAPPSYNSSSHTTTTTPPDPIIHKFNNQNRPMSSRRTIAINKVFASPITNLWSSKNHCSSSSINNNNNNKGFHSFNHLQSEMANVLANSDDNVIVSAPTGAGKTVLFEMAMARLLASNAHRRGGGGGSTGPVSKAQKILYLAPNKALCEERQLDWSKRLHDMDRSIVCTTITGGPNNNTINFSTVLADIASSHLIITTMEKWDSITRRWNEQFVLLASIKLVLVDEVHMIGEPERGGCLESVICRMKTIQRVACTRMLTGLEIASSSYKHTTPSALATNMRIVAVSATLPNIGHLASFIESGQAYSFDQSYRPVPLNVFVQACGHIGSNRYLFDKSLNQHVPSILKRFSSGRPAIVFCHSKKETEELAGELTKSYVTPSTLNESALMNFASMTDTASMHECIRKGIAFHHAGLDASDRRLVEQAFGSGSISCLCATSTLAMGVNLPSHLVVVKGTSAYRGANEGHQDIDTGTLLQMIGRAGRPGFDTSGTAVIMTDTLSKTRFENMSQGLKVVESHLMDDNRLTEVLNIEISQGVITSVTDAVNWVKGTFLYRRIQSHPLFYGCNGSGDDALNSFVLGKCSDSIDKLRKIRAIDMHDDDATFSPTPGCHVMSRNFIDFETMKDIIKLPHNSGPVQLLHMISNCSKIQTPVRRHEKKALNEAYKRIKYKLEGPQSKIRIQTPAEKSFVMLQAAIGRHYFEEFALRQQMTNIIDGASQVLSAIEQYAKEGSRNGQLATQGLLFRRSLFSSLWGENDGVLNQINGVTQEIASKLKASGISTFADVLRSSSEDIANACNVSDTFANSLRDAASTILQRTLKLSACSKDDGGQISLCVKLDRRAIESIEETSERIVSYSLVIFTDRAGGLLHYSENITKECEISMQCPDKFGRAYICLVSNLVGLDEQVTVDGNDNIVKSPILLSQSASKSTATKGKKRQQSIVAPLSSNKRPLEAHRTSVSNVSDLRLQKRGKVQEERTVDCHIPQLSDSEEASQPTTSTQKNQVTPSPHPHTKHQDSETATPRRNFTSSSGKRDVTTNQYQALPLTGQRPMNNSSLASTRMKRGGQNNSRSSWFQEKSHQKTAQQTAFNSPKENPFASYSFDPNNIENSLDSNANKSIEQAPTQSIIPNSNSNSTYTAESSRYSQSFRTPGNRRKNMAVSNRISSACVLQQKAAELQRHHSQTIAPRYATSDGYNNSRFYPTEDCRRMNQYEQLTETGYLNDPGMLSQSSYFHNRPGTSAGSVMQRSISMEPSSLSPPPYTIGCNHNLRIQQNNNMFMRGPIAANRMALSSSFTQHPPSRMRVNNFDQNMMYRSNGHPFEAYDFQLQNELQLQMHGNAETYPGYHHGMSQQRLYDSRMSDHSYHHGCDPRTNQVDYNSSDAFYGPTFGNMSVPDHASYEGVGGMNSNVIQACSFGNRSTHNQPTIRSGDGYANPQNPYHRDPPRQQLQQHQACLPINPYKTNQPQHQPLYHGDGMPDSDFPPMHEVVVQNNSVRSGLPGDDTSRFDDAFF